MTQIAKVRELKPGNIAEVALKRESACGKQCSQCAGCFSEARVIAVDASNEARADVGDTVVVESSSGRIISIAALVYLTPVLTFFIAYFCLASLSAVARISLAGACFFAGFAAPFFYSRRLSGRSNSGFYKITRIIVP